MQGMMMHRPLRIADLLEFAEDIHKTAEIVSVTVEGGMHRYTYPDMGARARRMAKALQALGIEMGDRVATLAWNGYRHLELYFAISGIGAVCHTINPRLSVEQMTYIIHHAKDRVIFVDLTFVPILQALSLNLPNHLRIDVMTDRAHMPDTTLDVLCYEDLIDDQDDSFTWPEFPEDTACGLCYTSGTTGNPKGALYTHRSTVLHSLFAVAGFGDGFRTGRRIMPVVPLFHASAWGLPYVAALMGISLVFPGAALDGASVYDLMENERVDCSWGVPTVWQGLLAEIEARGGAKPSEFREVIIGGSAASPSMIKSFEEMGVTVCHAWGMTEMSPIGTQGRLITPHTELPYEERLALKAKQGQRVFGVELKIVDEAGNRLPHDGAAQGELYVRGNCIVSGYLDNEEASAAAIDAEGWFGTGDVARIDPDGFLTLTDRAKDLIKSGGEWISSIDVENMAMSHADIATCAVIAIPDPKWDERPLLVAVAAEGSDPDIDSIRALLSERLAKWQVPEQIIFVDDLPLTATGKVSKLTLRERYAAGELA